MNGKKTHEISIGRTVKVTQQDIDDIMVAALEGGIDYWCQEAEVIEEKRVADWGHEQIARGGVLILHDAESDDKWELDLWIQNGDDRYHALQKDGTLDCCEIDSDMADMIVQYAIFGEVQFG